jgi:hypothetical protein
MRMLYDEDKCQQEAGIFAVKSCRTGHVSVFPDAVRN